jgi:hypothetical protein
MFDGCLTTGELYMSKSKNKSIKKASNDVTDNVTLYEITKDLKGEGRNLYAN